MDPLSFVSNIQPRINKTVNSRYEWESLDEFKNSYFYRVHLEWNKLPLELRIIEDYDSFQINLKEHIWELIVERPD